MPNQSWLITTAVGTGEPGFAGDGGPADRARLNGPFDIGFDDAGNLYFSDTFNHRIRRVDARTGIITTPPWPGSTSPTASRSTRRRMSTSLTGTTIASAGSTAPPG
jgi:hypothetical protein